MKRAGLFGGTFNPVHTGHLQVIQEAKESFNLDPIFIVPSAVPPHKESGDVADPKDRLEMTRLAFLGLDGFIVSDIEISRSGPSYTIDTVKQLKKELTKETELFLILGSDAFFEIDTWKSFQELFLLTPFIIMTRPGQLHNNEKRTISEIGDYLNKNVSDGYLFSFKEGGFVNREKTTIYLLKVTPIDISSTSIRSGIKKRDHIKSMVTEEVYAFIKKKELYL